MGIGAYALLLPLLMVMVKPVYAMAYNWLFAWFWAYNLVAFFGCALLLLPPTLLMGATLPILCRFYVDHLGHVGTRTGRLYGLNTVGAALGAFLTGFLLIRTLGVWNTLFAGAGINFLVGLTCMLAGRVSPASDSKKEGLRRARVANGRPGAPPIGADSPPGARWALWIFAVSGFCAMAYEVIWTRLLGLVIGPTVYSFTLVVGTFIVGLALGSVIFGLVGDRVQGALPILAGTQTGAALLALLVSQFFGNSQFFFAKLIYTLRDAFGEMMLLQGFMVFLLLLGAHAAAGGGLSPREQDLCPIDGPDGPIDRDRLRPQHDRSDSGVFCRRLYPHALSGKGDQPQIRLRAPVCDRSGRLGMGRFSRRGENLALARPFRHVRPGGAALLLLSRLEPPTPLLRPVPQFQGYGRRFRPDLLDRGPDEGSENFAPTRDRA